MSLQKGDIVLVPFPFTDLSGRTKPRPAVVLWIDVLGNDVTLCFVSSQNIENVSVSEFIIDCSDPEFTVTGLKETSKVRVTKIATIERRFITRRLGKLGIRYIQRLNTIIFQEFQLIIKSTFIALVNQWITETHGVSSTNQMCMHTAYQQIIGMGEPVIPLLLRELEEKSGRWFWALKSISREDPVPPEYRGNTEK
jgi:mRNA interferase MazF